MKLDITARYSVKGYPNVEFTTTGWCMVWVPDDEYKKEGSWVPDPSSNQAIMVPIGDPETELYVNIEDITKL